MNVAQRRLDRGARDDLIEAHAHFGEVAAKRVKPALRFLFQTLELRRRIDLSFIEPFLRGA